MTPFALIALFALLAASPLMAVAKLWGIYPHRRLALAALAPFALSLTVLAADWGMVLMVAGWLTWAAVALIDVVSLPRADSVGVERRCGRVASLRKPHPVMLTVTNHSRRPINLAIRDGADAALNPEPAEAVLSLAPRGVIAVGYQLRPSRRGSFAINGCHVRLESPWRLWHRHVVYPVVAALHVYPDLQQLRQYALLARTDRLALVGVRRTRRVGQDHEFERLRDYTTDDNYKHIDWRATARRRKLIVRDYQSSQNQRVVLLIDYGRMMANTARGLTLLDHALNAALMLAYVALRQGDAVGLIAFADEVARFVPPRAGRMQMNRLLHAVFDCFPRMVESRYDLAFRHLAAHCRRRALVVLLTNIIDQVNANSIERYLTHLSGRHLPLAVLPRDERLFAAVADEHPLPEKLFEAAAAAHILAWRHRLIADLRRHSALVVDALPNELTAPLINRYLEVKARHLL